MWRAIENIGISLKTKNSNITYKALLVSEKAFSIIREIDEKTKIDSFRYK